MSALLLESEEKGIKKLLTRLVRRVSRQPERLKGMRSHPGTCNICGNVTAFYYDDEKLYRESLFCDVCRTTSRYRSISRGILRAIREIRGVESSSLVGLDPKLNLSLMKVYDTQVPFYWETCCYPIPDLLSKCDWIDVQRSMYQPREPLGAHLAPNTTNQNLEALTFKDETFDVVITSDVMEHVRLDERAHSEIRRVLKPGGFYVFTVPHFRHIRETLTRVAVVDPSNPEMDQFLMKKEYHGDANSEDGRALSYRVYGSELDEFLEKLGFNVEYSRHDFPELGIINTELFFCRLSG